MIKHRINYHQRWGYEIVKRFRRVWNGQFTFKEVANVFAPSFVFHYHTQTIKGISEYCHFIREAKQVAPRLDLMPLKIFSHDDKVLFYFRWTSETWHSDIVGGNPFSNCCKVVFRIENGKIAEKWEQAPDFIYMLGNSLPPSLMEYPSVLSDNLFLRDDQDNGLYPTEDPKTVFMSNLFKSMNDCFMGLSPLSKIKDIQHEDILFYMGNREGQGIAEWKTFAHALHTALDGALPERVNDLYIREKNRLTVFSQAQLQEPASFKLDPSFPGSIHGMVGYLNFEMKDEKIRTLYTHTENYLPLLGTDFTRHEERIKKLFQGKRLSVPFKTNEQMKKKLSQSRAMETRSPDSKAEYDRKQVAIVGMAGKFPNANSVEEYWENLKSGQAFFSQIPDDRSYIKEATKIRCAGLVANIDQFDALFFNIPPVLAEYMDPQQRLLMEVIWHCIEDSGHKASDFSGPRTGLFVSTQSDDYKKLLQDHQMFLNPNYWLGNESAMFPAKIAYFLDIQGPCQFINTECTSSLVAIHEASQRIREGSIDQAIVGAANLFLHTYGFAVREDTLLSTENRPYLFSKKSQGQLRGEAVVAVILKSLSNALQDKDEIYGLVAGSAVNNNGRAFSLGTTSVEKQAEVMMDAWRNAAIDPSELSLIECHASGVREGDFAEIASIKKAFRQMKAEINRKPVCFLTSVKGTIGHAEAASGLTVLVKLLLQLRHQRIIGIQGLDAVDPNLELDQSDLALVKDHRPWKRRQEHGQERVRVAAINAFATGGYNAHVVIKEYMEPQTPNTLQEATRRPVHPVIIVLSAKREEDLKRLLSHFQEFLTKHPNTDLIDLAYTLQVGREAMEHRIAFVVYGVDELVQQIDGVIKNKKNLKQVFIGKKERKPPVHSLSTEEGHNYITQLVLNKKFSQVAELWSHGYPIPWERFEQKEEIRRMVGLPNYPFAGERYWIDEISDFRFQISDLKNQLHPLLHENTSDFSEQRFSSVFTGEEFFLKDHQVKEHKVFPGVAYLEMAQTAIKQASAKVAHQKQRLQLKHVVWSRPMVVGDQPVEVNIRLFPEENGEIQYETYTTHPSDGKSEDEIIVHSQGMATFSSTDKTSTLDLKALQKRCRQQLLSAEQCYDAFKGLGFGYGPAYKGLENIWVGGDEVLAKLTLSVSVAETKEQFTLHPSLLDAAVQSSIGMGYSDEIPGNMSGRASWKPSLPFALESLEIIDRCQESMWTWVRWSESSRASDKVQKLDIDLCDDNGKICVRMKGLASRVLEGEMDAIEKIETLMCQPTWREEAVSKNGHPSVFSHIDGIRSNRFEYAQHLVMFCELGVASLQSLAAKMNGASCLQLQSGQKDPEQRFQAYAIQACDHIQTIIQGEPKGKVLIQIVVPSQAAGQLFCGLSGVLKTMHLENPNILGQLIEIEDNQGLSDKLEENSRRPEDPHIRYRDGKRMVAFWEEVRVSQEKVNIPWKEGGIYLITGGADGLDVIFAKEIADKTKNVTLILGGRSELSEEKRAKLKELKNAGVKVEYKVVDICEKESVKELVNGIQSVFGGLDGIIHGAEVIRDKVILGKNNKEWQEVLASQLSGVVNLDQASEDLPLDFFLLFSWSVGALANPEQANYTTANAFVEAYASYRNDLVTSKQRKGHTLSIIWPPWKKDVKKIDETSKTMMRDAGVIAMQTSSGIQALYQAFAAGKLRVMVLERNLKRLQASLVEKSLKEQELLQETIESNSQPVSMGRDMLEEKAIHYFKKRLSSALKWPLHRIHAEEPLEKYGIDSVMVTQLTNELEKTFGTLSKTLFFEYQTIKEVTDYFLESHREKLQAILNVEGIRPSVKGVAPKAVIEKESAKRTPRRSRFAFRKGASQETRASEVLDIAIIGLSGRYPKARDLQAYWENLQEGKDCITEVPKDRWDWREYYTEDRSQLERHISKWGGFIEDADKFDPLFFNISPREAEIMDPKERLFLETVWSLLEGAGYTRTMLQGKYQSKVGIFVGAMYQQYHSFDSDLLKQAAISLSSYGFIANRLSYFFGFHGPSIAIDTMCSSSLIAIHMACESLTKEECYLAIAGGVNLSIHPNKYLALSQAQMIGSHRNSRSFGDGDGYLPSEGVGAVLLKPLTKAIHDRDPILAVIKSTATNHGGHTNGFTVPNPNAQAQLIEDNFIKSKIDPRSISYVESAANGSPLGDAIEVSALNKAFRKFTSDQTFCAIGSVKSNIGHAEAASGISQLTKVVLQLQHQQLVPTINATPLNPNLNFDGTPFYLQQELREWKRPLIKIDGEELEVPRRATVSSFGAGGSNAHLIVEEYDDQSSVTSDQSSVSKISHSGNNDQLSVKDQPELIVLSAKNEARLREIVKNLHTYLENQIINHKSKMLNLHDLTYTLQVGREPMDSRVAMVVRSHDELIHALKAYLKLIKGDKDIEASVPIFLGCLSDNHSGMRNLLSGNLGETVVSILLEGKNLEKLGLYWTQGGEIPWESLYEGEELRKIPLPTYPFKRKRYWIGAHPHSVSVTKRPGTLNDTMGPVETTNGSVENIVVTILSNLLGMKETEEEIKHNKPLDHYGLDSILSMRFFQELQAQVDPFVDLAKLQECKTVQDILAILPTQIERKKPGKSPLLLDEDTRTIPESLPHFPELIHLHQSAQGRPVFWIHSGLGGVEMYQALAKKSQRPFYGIQARGWMTERSPLHGIQAMAAYYVHIIQSIQPEGPYELGGYSLGGMLAYEVTRQLQELRRPVSSVVMLDTIDSTRLKQMNVSEKTRFLQAINIGLQSVDKQDPETLSETLIHRNEVDPNQDETALLKQLITLARKRGLKKTNGQMQTMIQQIAKLQHAYEAERFSILPLSDPQGVTCYYFRNERGLFFGEAEPYFLIKEREVLDPTNYWSDWERELPNLHIMDVDASSHMTLLSEPKVSETIFKFCEILYSREGLLAKDLKSFKNGISKKHELISV